MAGRFDGGTRRVALCAPLLVLALLAAGTVRAQESRAVGMRILVVQTEEDMRAALAAVKAGTPFETVVRERSIGPNRERGGYLGRMDPAALAPEARAAIAGVRRGSISPVFRTEGGFAVIRVVTTEAEETLEQQGRDRAEALKLLEQGTALGQEGKLEEAVQALQRAVALDADLADAQYNLAIAYRKLGRTDAAITALMRVTQLEPRDYEVRIGLGNWLTERGRHLEASQQYERAALLRLDSVEAWRKLAESYEAAGQVRAAVGAYRRVLGLLGQDDPAVLTSLLRVALQAKDGPSAMEAARKIEALHQDHEGYLALGKALLLNGQTEEAVGELEKAAALAPSSVDAQAALGTAYAALGRSDEAIQHLVQAIELGPKDPALYRTLSRIYAASGRLDLAIVSLRDGVAAASPRPLQAEMMEELATLYDRAGMTREAARERRELHSLPTP